MILGMQQMTSQVSQASASLVDALDDISVGELSQLKARLDESDRERLAEFYALLIAEAGAEVPSRSDGPAGASRRARRVERQRADRLVRVLSTAQRSATRSGSGVAA